MNRRGFLTLLATGAVGACVATKIPTGWIPESGRRLVACEYLRTSFNAFYTQHHRLPERLIVGRELHEAYEAEVETIRRFMSTDPKYPFSPLFKGRPLSLQGRGWGVTCV